MLAPIDFSRIQTALSAPDGWLELGMVAVCLAVAWRVDRRALEARGVESANEGAHRLRASFINVLFPATALALVLFAAFVYHRYVRDNFDIGLQLRGRRLRADLGRGLSAMMPIADASGGSSRMA